VDKSVESGAGGAHHPASAPGNTSGSVTREGHRETGPRTDRVAPDRRPDVRNDDAGGGAHPRAGDPAGSIGDRGRAPLPTRVSDLPALPAAFSDALRAELERLDIALEPQARAAIDAHVRLLLAWNPAINLTRIVEPRDVAVLHVADSLSGARVVAGLGAGGTAPRILDLGSGGGFPGLPLAIAIPGARVLLVDSVAKKVRFLETATAAAGVGDRVRVTAARAEDLGADRTHRGKWDAVTARAVGSLADLLELALPLLRIGGALVAWKRGDLGGEIAAASAAARALGGAPPEVQAPVGGGLLADHRLVVVTKRTATPAGYPRDPGVRRKRPWAGPPLVG
jgi:16S rRNA (guanine527-N7)-methyltransferase